MNTDHKRNITYLTAGAAGMYCGSCMHDNTLARALNQAGWSTLLVPTYTPIRTDETDTTVDEVFFGGINVYLQQKIPVFRLVPRFLDRILDRPWLIRKVTSRAIETDAKMLGGLTVSMLKGKDGNQKKEVRRLVHWLRATAHPDVLVLSNILIAGFVESLKQHLRVPVVVTLQGDDIFLESLQEPHKSQAIELIGKIDRKIDAYIVHSRFYADFMAEYLKLDRSKMHITPLGIDTRDFENMADDTSPVDQTTIGYLARMTADKGLHVLIDAFVELKKDPAMQSVQLELAGWQGPDHKDFVDLQMHKLQSANLVSDCRSQASIDRSQKLRMLQNIDVLSVPTVYHEPKGLFALEAMAAGVPVVQPAHGVFPEMIEELGGGVLFEPEDPLDLATKLKDLITSTQRRAELGAQGRQNVLTRRNAQTMAQDTIAVLEALVD